MDNLLYLTKRRKEVSNLVFIYQEMLSKRELNLSHHIGTKSSLENIIQSHENELDCINACLHFIKKEQNSFHDEIINFQKKLIELIQIGKKAESKILSEVGECLDAELIDEIIKKLESIKKDYFFSDFFRDDTADS